MGKRNNDLLEMAMRDYFNGDTSYEAFINDINNFGGVDLTPDQANQIAFFGQQVQSGNQTEAWGRNNIYQSLNEAQGSGTSVTPTTPAAPVTPATPNYSSGLTEEEARQIVANASAKKSTRDNIFSTASMWDTVNAANKTLNDFTYEAFQKTPDYATLVENYQRGGNRAMQDTLGQISARTGGLASTYAGGAAQGAYNNYMDKLEEIARQMYAQERGYLADQRDYALSMAKNNYDVMRNERAYQDDVNDRVQSEAQDRVANYIGMGGDASKLDSGLVKQSGYTPEEVDAMTKYYLAQQMATQENTNDVVTPEVTDLNEKMRIAGITTEKGAINYLTQLNKYDDLEIANLVDYYINTYIPSQNQGNDGETARILTGNDELPEDVTYTNKIGFNDDGTIEWIVVGSYGGRISGKELATKINNGEVVPVYDPKNNTITFRKA